MRRKKQAVSIDGYDGERSLDIFEATIGQDVTDVIRGLRKSTTKSNVAKVRRNPDTMALARVVLMAQAQQEMRDDLKIKSVWISPEEIARMYNKLEKGKFHIKITLTRIR